MQRPSKQRIRQAFGRAARSYDQAAQIQQAICRLLARQLADHDALQHWLDAGCGTGFAQPLLSEKYPQAQGLALDLAAEMLLTVSNTRPRIQGDLEALPMARHSLDLYWSSLSVQWCDLPQVLREARRVLKPQGQLLIATLGPQTFQEVRQAFAQVDRYAHTLPFLTHTQIAEMADACSFMDVQIEQHILTSHYPDFRTLLHAVKAIGANQLGDGRRTGLMSRSALTQATAAMENLRTPAGLPLTYEVITLNART